MARSRSLTRGAGILLHLALGAAFPVMSQEAPGAATPPAVDDAEFFRAACDVFADWSGLPQGGDSVAKGRSELLNGFRALNRGDFTTAHGHFIAAEEPLRRARDSIFLGYSLLARAHLCMIFGDLPEATRLIEKAAAEVEPHAGRFGKSLVLAARARLAWALGDYWEALRLAEEGLGLARQGGFTGIQPSLHWIAGVAHRESGDIAGARAALTKAIQAEEWHSDSGRQWCAAESWAKLDLSDAEFLDSGSDENFATFWWAPARTELRRKRYLEALESYAKYQRKADPVRAFDAAVGMGLSHEGLRDYSKATEHFRNAVDIVEASRSLTPLSQRAHFLGMRGREFSRLDAVEGLVRAVFREGDGAAEAFRLVEHTRARQFAELLALRGLQQKYGIPAQMASDVEAGASRLQELRLNLATGFTRVEGPDTDTLRTRVREAEAAFDESLRTLRERFPSYAAVAHPLPLSPPDVKLAADEVLIEYEVMEPYTLVFLLKSGRVAAHFRIPVTRRDLTYLVDAYREAFQGVEDSRDLERYDPSLSERIYRLLLAPILEAKESGSRLVPEESRIIIAPDEMLTFVPFESLVYRRSREASRPLGARGVVPVGVRYVGDTYDIAYAQSATALVVDRSLRALRPPSKAGALIVADPVFDATDPRLRTASADPERAQNPAAREVLVKMGVGGGKTGLGGRERGRSRGGGPISPLEPNERDGSSSSEGSVRAAAYDADAGP